MTITLCPYRFSANPPATIEFLKTLGLVTEVTTSGGGFAVLRGRSGAVAVHGARTSDVGAQPGQTQLAGIVQDAEAAAERLRGAGLDTVVWDESYGRHAGLRDPRGGGIWLNEQRDFYGYRLAEPADPAPFDVVAVYYTDDFPAAAGFFASLGFVPAGPGDQWWQALHAQDGAAGGVVGLHRGDPGDGVGPQPVSPDDPVGPPALVRLGFETSEDLDALAARLVAAGYPDARVVDDGDVVAVHVTDPDGQHLEIHPVP